jgi:hypothetical protein
MNKTLKILVLLLFVSASTAYSQGGSNYSIIGIGDINRFHTAAQAGVAGTQIAMPSTHGINTLNPALWSKLTHTRLQIGYRFNQSIVTEQDDNIWQNNGGLDGIIAAFAIDTSKGITASLGFIPYSTVRYLIAQPISVNDDGVLLEGQNTFQGEGGITTAYFGGSYEPIKGQSFGAMVLANIGKITTTYSSILYDDNSTEVVTRTDDAYRGMGFRFGYAGEFFDNFMIGAYYEKNMKVGIQREIFYDPNVIPQEIDSCDSKDYQVPDAIGFGLSYISGKFLIGADVKSQNFSNFEYNKPEESTDDTPMLYRYKNMMQYSVGVKRFGNPSRSSTFLDKITYTFGLGYRDLYYNVRGQKIDEFYASVGFEVPVIGTTLIDMALIGGSRGTTNNGLIREMFFTFMLDISIGETWFVPFKRDF